MQPVNIDAKKIVPDYITDLIMQRDELVIGVIRTQIIPSRDTARKGAFYIIAAMPLETEWKEGMNYAPLAVYYRDETKFTTLGAFNEAAPEELLPVVTGIAYAITMQGADVYTHQPFDIEKGEMSSVSFALSNTGRPDNSWVLGDPKLELPKVEIFNPGTPPKTISLLRENSHPKLGVVPKARLEKWLSDKMEVEESIKKARSSNPCGEIELESTAVYQTSENYSSI